MSIYFTPEYAIMILIQCDVLELIVSKLELELAIFNANCSYQNKANAPRHLRKSRRYLLTPGLYLCFFQEIILKEFIVMWGIRQINLPLASPQDRNRAEAIHEKVRINRFTDETLNNNNYCFRLE